MTNPKPPSTLIDTSADLSSTESRTASGNQADTLCVNCGENQYKLYPSPKGYVSGKHLTLFGWTVLLYREKDMVTPVDELCDDCLIDRANANERDHIDSVLNDAYSKGYEDGEKQALSNGNEY